MSARALRRGGLLGCVARTGELSEPCRRHLDGRETAEQGHYAEAFDRLGKGGLQRETTRAESAETLLSLADIARLSGHASDATAPLERLLAEHGSDPSAPVAAFTLGRIRLDTLGDPARAADAFARALALGPPRGIEEDVHARLVEARALSGDSLGAEAAAARYLKKFPAGRYAHSIGQWTASP